MNLIEKIFTDQDGTWYISEVNDGMALITCIDENSPNYLEICEIPVEEAIECLEKEGEQNDHRSTEKGNSQI